MPDELPEIGAFAARFQDFMEAMHHAAVRADPPHAEPIRAHLGVDPQTLPSTAADFSTADHANLQLALDAVLPDAELLGFSTRHAGHIPVGLNELLTGESMAGAVRMGPVQYTDVEVGDGRVVKCVSAGVYLARRGGAPLVLVLSRGERPWGGSNLRLEGVSPEREAVSATVRDLRAAMREHNVFRGKVISLHAQDEGAVSVIFHRLAPVRRDAVILPDGTLERLERHALGIAAHAERLRAAGRHLKRGILLHGPPGTGKTLSVNYLLAAMPGRTTVLLTGRGLGLIEQALAIARDLAPATVVFEDVDLVAAERTMEIGNHGILFELLNQMEGLAEDADLLFLLTSNRPDLIEPALAARPGRVDLALEIPLPDEAARRRLVHLYAGEVALDEAAVAGVVKRTEGVSGAFVKELMRQAALRASLEERDPPGAPDVTAALDDLLADRSALTRRLLGEHQDGHPPPGMVRAAHAAGLYAVEWDD